MLKHRLPSRPDLSLVFTTCVLVIQAWAFVNVSREVPAFRLRLTAWEVLGIIAYIQAFALLESLAVLGLTIVAAVVLPGPALREQFTAQASVWVLISAGWALAIHLAPQSLSTWDGLTLMAWLLPYALTLGLSAWLVRRVSLVQRVINAVVGRVTMLAQVYAVIGALGLVIVIIRNLA